MLLILLTDSDNFNSTIAASLLDSHTQKNKLSGLLGKWITGDTHEKPHRKDSGESNPLCVPGSGLPQDLPQCPKVGVVQSPVCLLSFTVKPLIPVTLSRMEISVCVDPGNKIRSSFGASTQREPLLSQYLDKVLLLPINTFSSLTP